MMSGEIDSYRTVGHGKRADINGPHVGATLSKTAPLLPCVQSSSSQRPDAPPDDIARAHFPACITIKGDVSLGLVAMHAN